MCVWCVCVCVRECVCVRIYIFLFWYTSTYSCDRISSSVFPAHMTLVNFCRRSLDTHLSHSEPAANTSRASCSYLKPAANTFRTCSYDFRTLISLSLSLVLARALSPFSPLSERSMARRRGDGGHAGLARLDCQCNDRIAKCNSSFAPSRALSHY